MPIESDKFQHTTTPGSSQAGTENIHIICTIKTPKNAMKLVMWRSKYDDYLDFFFDIVQDIEPVFNSAEPLGSHAPSSFVVVVVDVVAFNVQMPSPLKPLGQSEPNFIWSNLRKGEPKFV